MTAPTPPSDQFELSTEGARLDFDVIFGWLSTDAYWALGRPRDVVERAAAGSLNIGAYRLGDGAQVAYARAVTDGATFAWICDVYVDRAERGRGLGTWMVGELRDRLHAFGVNRLVLATLNAHGVYARLGFSPLDEPARWMDLRTPRPI